MSAKERIFKAIGIYSMILGAAVLVMWLMILSRETIGEGDTEMAFHLVSEFLMASLCVGSGIFLAKGVNKGAMANLAGHSMVVYSVLNAAGYYAERGQGIMVPVFLVLLVLSASILAIHFTVLVKT